MAEHRIPRTRATGPASYRIRLHGHLSRTWADRFEGMTASEEDGDTLLTGPVADQAALHGLLKRVRDLGLTLVSVRRLQPGREDPTGS